MLRLKVDVKHMQVELKQTQNGKVFFSDDLKVELEFMSSGWG